MLEAEHAYRLAEEEAYWAEVKSQWTDHFDEKLNDLKIQHASELGETIRAVTAINTATLKLKDRTVTIRTVHREEYRTTNATATNATGRQPDEGSGDEGSGAAWHAARIARRTSRQHGGPVGAGRPYLVGEAGPELFVPSRSGRIEPNVLERRRRGGCQRSRQGRR